MNKTLLSLITCFLAITSVYAQTLFEAKVTTTMYRAFELHKTKQYTEALEAFLTVGENVDACK